MINMVLEAFKMGYGVIISIVLFILLLDWGSQQAIKSLKKYLNRWRPIEEYLP